MKWALGGERRTSTNTNIGGCLTEEDMRQVGASEVGVEDSRKEGHIDWQISNGLVGHRNESGS